MLPVCVSTRVTVTKRPLHLMYCFLNSFEIALIIAAHFSIRCYAVVKPAMGFLLLFLTQGNTSPVLNVREIVNIMGNQWIVKSY